LSLTDVPQTRFADYSRGNAVAVAATFLVAVIVLALVAAGYHPPKAAPSKDAGDLATYVRIVADMRHGQDYYAAAHTELVNGHYGTRSVFNWRLPVLFWIAAALPTQAAVDALLQAVALVTLAVSCLWLRRTTSFAITILAAVALAGNLCTCFDPNIFLFSDITAGTLILLSVALYGLRLPLLGFAVGLLALFCRELVAPYVVLCAVMAWRDRRWWEVGGWVAGIVAFAAYFAWHYFEVHAHIGPHDVAYSDTWFAFGGLNFILGTATFNGIMVTQPFRMTALVLPLGLLGLLAWRNEGSARAGLTVAVYLALFLFVGKHFDDYWGALYTPLLMIGIAFAPLALVDLIRALGRQPPELAEASGQASP